MDVGIPLRKIRRRRRGVDEMRLCTPLLFYREAVGRYRRDVRGDIEEWTKGGSVPCPTHLQRGHRGGIEKWT